MASETMDRPDAVDRFTIAGTPIPSHVPSSLIFDLDFHKTPTTGADPFAISANIAEIRPPIFYARDTQPASHDGVWVCTKYDDIRHVYQDYEHYSSVGVANFQSLLGEVWPMIPIGLDPPDHGKYRLLLNPWFSPRAVTEMEPMIRDAVDGLIKAFEDKGEADLAYDFARVYPVKVFLSLMGFPFEKLDDFLSWGYAILHERPNVERMTWGARNAVTWIREYIEQVKVTPNDGLASRIVHGQIEGRPLTEDEIIGTIFFLWIGGLDTVAATTSLMLRTLAQRPDLQKQLRDDPGLVADAIEEFMRVQPLVNSVRTVTKDHEYKGIQMKAGEKIMCYNLAGNFDPDEFADPREIKLDRQFNRHFTLAGGPHRCLGSHLARRELRIALAELLARIPEFRMKPGVENLAYPGLIAAAHLPVIWDKA